MEPTETKGFNVPSRIMVDKMVALPREKCGKVIGHIDKGSLIALNHMPSVIVGIAD